MALRFVVELLNSSDCCEGLCAEIVASARIACLDTVLAISARPSSAAMLTDSSESAV